MVNIWPAFKCKIWLLKYWCLKLILGRLSQCRGHRVKVCLSPTLSLYFPMDSLLDFQQENLHIEPCVCVSVHILILLHIYIAKSLLSVLFYALVSCCFSEIFILSHMCQWLCFLSSLTPHMIDGLIGKWMIDG